jgi:hypothetical protein
MHHLERLHRFSGGIFGFLLDPPIFAGSADFCRICRFLPDLPDLAPINFFFLLSRSS